MDLVIVTQQVVLEKLTRSKFSNSHDLDCLPLIFLMQYASSLCIPLGITFDYSLSGGISPEYRFTHPLLVLIKNRVVVLSYETSFYKSLQKILLSKSKIAFSR